MVLATLGITIPNCPLSSSGVTTIGVPIGMAIIIFSVLITGLYVRRANGEFDRMTQEIIEEATQ